MRGDTVSTPAKINGTQIPAIHANHTRGLTGPDLATRTPTVMRPIVHPAGRNKQLQKSPNPLGFREERDHLGARGPSRGAFEFLRS